MTASPVNPKFGLSAMLSLPPFTSIALLGFLLLFASPDMSPACGVCSVYGQIGVSVPEALYCPEKAVKTVDFGRLSGTIKADGSVAQW